MSASGRAATADAVGTSPPTTANSNASSPTGGKKTILKVILLGPACQAGTGKTSLLNRFVDDAYQPLYKATLGADMRDVEVMINDEPVVLQIWDTAGQERFHSLTSMFLKGANMVLLVFDMTRADSFESLTLWRDQFLKSTKNDADFPFAVVANNWCSQHGDMSYTECSAKEGSNVHQAFMDLARRAVKKMAAERAAEHAAFAAPPPSVVLTNSSHSSVTGGLQSRKKKKNSNCCT